ncbi:MAG: M20/M25/M40 family metallo-hydrolase [Candidatus Thermoplasmatota archaeon]|nr:M20/M25/M40 family metallo-hydrolase [Candidatus Thermoplasmatota archaeon]
MKHVVVALVAICLVAPSVAVFDASVVVAHASAVDTDDVMDDVSQGMVRGYVQALQDIGPRVTETAACDEAADYIAGEFSSYGLSVREHDWDYNDYEGVNVEATLPGVNRSSNRVYVICAHYDTVPGSPGADDDGSGVAAVLAAARTLSTYQFQHTVRFVTFSGEEEGLLGSHEYAREANESHENIVGVLNADMIGYTETETGRHTIEIQEVPSSEWMTNLSITLTQQYPALNLTVSRERSHPYSDHHSFISYGFNATFFFEYEFNDYYHSSEDTIDKMDLDYATRVTRLMVGTLTELAVLAEGDWEPPTLTFERPQRGALYVQDDEAAPLPFGMTVIVGSITLEVSASDNDSAVDRVEFYVDGELAATDTAAPYTHVWDERALLFHRLEAKAYDTAGNAREREIRALVFNL